MSKVRERGEALRRYLIEQMDAHPTDVARLAAEHFNCSRQAVHKHLQRLIAEGAVAMSGATKNRRYTLASLLNWQRKYDLTQGVAEDRVWREDILPLLGKLPDNVVNIWHYGFTEMLNNAIDHSAAQYILITLFKTAATTQIAINDNGVGIFKKIQAALNLADERHAVLELAKGKFTTDPANHTGEGIFFSSRMFDEFRILSGDVYFSHDFAEKEDWILQARSEINGTHVTMRLNNHTARTSKKIFDKFSSGDDYGFNRTVVPVKLMRYGDDNLISRSQAKRLLARIDRFKTVILDFSGVATIGQAFADEVFRVFQSKYPALKLEYIHASSSIKRMIARAKSLLPETDA